MKHKKIVIAEGAGFIGQTLAKHFGKDNHIVILSRQTVNGHNNNNHKSLLRATDGYNITYWRWDGRHVEKHWKQDIEGAHIVIHLADQPVNRLFSQKTKQQVISNCTDTVETMGNAIRQAITPPRLWINVALTAVYRQYKPVGVPCENNSDKQHESFFYRLRLRWLKTITAIRYGRPSKQYKDLDPDFSMQFCRQWENIFLEQQTPFTRKIALYMATPGEKDLGRIVEWYYDRTEMEGVFNR